MSEDAREAALAHFGVPGMKWGVRKARANTPGRKSSGGSAPKGKSSPKNKTLPVKKLTPQEAEKVRARSLARREIGKNVGIAVLASAGGIAAGAIGGPLAGAATSAALREAGKWADQTFGSTTTTRSTDSSGNMIVREESRTFSGKPDGEAYRVNKLIGYGIDEHGTKWPIRQNENIPFDVSKPHGHEWKSDTWPDDTTDKDR